jgi:hypothetical protein
VQWHHPAVKINHTRAAGDVLIEEWSLFGHLNPLFLNVCHPVQAIRYRVPGALIRYFLPKNVDVLPKAEHL